MYRLVFRLLHSFAFLCTPLPELASRALAKDCWLRLYSLMIYAIASLKCKAFVKCSVPLLRVYGIYV